MQALSAEPAGNGTNTHSSLSFDYCDVWEILEIMSKGASIQGRSTDSKGGNQTCSRNIMLEGGLLIASIQTSRRKSSLTKSGHPLRFHDHVYILVTHPRKEKNYQTPKKWSHASLALGVVLVSFLAAIFAQCLHDQLPGLPSTDSYDKRLRNKSIYTSVPWEKKPIIDL